MWKLDFLGWLGYLHSEGGSVLCEERGEAAGYSGPRRQDKNSPQDSVAHACGLSVTQQDAKKCQVSVMPLAVSTPTCHEDLQGSLQTVCLLGQGPAFLKFRMNIHST